MVAIIIHHHDLLSFPLDLKTALYSTEILEAHCDRGKRHLEFHANSNRSQGIQDIVTSRHADIQFTECFATIVNRKAGTIGLMLYFGSLEIRLTGQPISDQAFLDFGNHPLQVFIVQTKDNQAVERDLIDKINKRCTDLIQVLVIIEVILINVGHHCNGRRQFQKRTIRFVCFCHQKFTLTQLGIGTYGVETTAYDYGRVDPAVGEDGCHHAGGCRLTMSPGNGNAMLHAHQFSQHFGPGDHRNLATMCFLHFGITLVNCC